jgi:two-component system sensor histidine kinase KdpD
MRSLYEFTRRTLQMNLAEKPGQQLADLLFKLFSLDAVAVYDADLNEVSQSGQWTIDPGELAQNVYHFETSDEDSKTGMIRRVVRIGAVPIGSLVLRGELNALAGNALAAIVAITLDRYRATANETLIESEREAERMRATVLDSLAHAYKTPLTAIRAASSGLAEMGRLSPAQAELVALIDEQAAFLNHLTTRLLATARLEAAHSDSPLALRIERIAAASLVEEVVASLGDRAAGTSIRIDLSPENLEFRGDRSLVSMILTQYLDNACKYSDAGSVITVSIARADAEILFSVQSFGAVIPAADRERIFDRYYRSSATATRAAGTGIGLNIAKRAALAHGGSVWVASDQASGTTFFAAIPSHSEPASPAAPQAAVVPERSNP